jgi:hypothetical protein
MGGSVDAVGVDEYSEALVEQSFDTLGKRGFWKDMFAESATSPG